MTPYGREDTPAPLDTIHRQTSILNVRLWVESHDSDRVNAFMAFVQSETSITTTWHEAWVAFTERQQA